MALLALFLGGYLLIAGIVLLLKGLAHGFILSGNFSSQPHALPTFPHRTGNHSRSSRRAIIFVRR
jgi:hypothetical protein